MKSIDIPLPAGFSTNTQPDDALAIALYGEEGTGKTRFCITAPDPIGFIPLERKSRQTAHSVSQELGKVVIMPDHDFIRTAQPMKLQAMSDDAHKTFYRQHVDSIKTAAYTLYSIPEVKTIVIDSGTQLWEDILFANYGRMDRIMARDRGTAYAEIGTIFKSLSGKNLIITHHPAEVWKNDKPTGKTKPKTFPYIGHHMNAICEMTVDKSNGAWGMNVIHCQANPTIQGPDGVGILSGDDISFDNLAYLIDPDWQDRVASGLAKAATRKITGGKKS